MRKFLSYIIGSFLICLAGCATSFKLSTSPPGVEVYSGEKSLGVTPLLIDPKSGLDEKEGGYLFTLVDSRHRNVQLWLPKGIRGIDLEVNMKPFVIPENQEFAIDQQKIYQISHEFMTVQTEILTGQSGAKEKLDALARKYPEFAAVFFLQANLDAIENNMNAAESNCQRAYAINPTQFIYAQCGKKTAQNTKENGE